jgi:hypothetical protein
MPTTDQPIMTVNKNGTTCWRLKNGKRHRVDGPAYEGVNGDKVWYLNGKCHRVDGPAIEGVNGYKSWHLNSQQYCHTRQNSHDFIVSLVKWCEEVEKLNK